MLSFAADVVDINAADMETLMSVKGIGEKRAMAIIDHREQHGPFRSVDELTIVRGVSEALVDKSRERLVVKKPR
ncbi:MAG: helix-hairpin-helix domain-containing protein [Gammaproteobacteria bacterium]|nr:helix-hairpin-helix domain-containing protein [Gammaproteobacteria bacterium]